MFINEKTYWWCKKCSNNVDVLQAHDIGIFCIHCGSKVFVPKNIPDPKFFDTDDEEYKDFPHDEEEVLNEDKDN